MDQNESYNFRTFIIISFFNESTWIMLHLHLSLGIVEFTWREEYKASGWSTNKDFDQVDDLLTIELHQHTR